MADIEYSYPFTAVHGMLNKKDPNKTTCRQKHYHDEKGNVIGESNPEAHIILNPRDYTKNPPKGAELANIQAFQQAALRVKAELADPDRHAYWLARWHAQLQHGEPEAPINPKTHQPKIYLRLDKFILATLMREFKQNL